MIAPLFFSGLRMFLHSFIKQNNDLFQVSALNGSRFAKEVANDFNPLHDADSKRFVVPGDLLFSKVLSELGIAQKMTFRYQGMVSADAKMMIEQSEQTFRVVDQQDKTYLSGEFGGECCDQNDLIEAFCRNYVAFSGHSFPHILVPLMKEQGVMINPARPMVIYESMSFEFFEPVAALSGFPSLELSNSTFEVNGKRGKVHIEFDIVKDENVIGHGKKTMTLSGLRAFDQDAVDTLVLDYERAKSEYLAKLS
jgi:hypothetical protein